MRNQRKHILQQIINEKPEAVLVKNKYKVILGMLKRIYPMNFKKISEVVTDKILLDIIFDAINGNRDWQYMTEGHDKETKKILSQQYIVDNYMK